MSVLQPSASEKFRIINRNNQVFDGGKTVLEIIADFNSAGIDCDSIVCHAYDNSNGFGGFLPLKVGTKDAYYIGDENAGESLGTNTTLFQATENVWNGHFYRYQADWTLADFGAVSLSKRTINNIEYWYDYDGNVITPPMIYIGANVGILYINNSPDIPTSLGGGAGSGYIGNSLLSNKKMVGFNVPTSSAESTKTESVNTVSASAVSGKPKSGNGFARIKFLRGPEWDIVGTWIDGKTIYKKDFDFHNANGIGVQDEFILDLPECERLFLADTCWINVNPPNEDVIVFPFPYVHTNPEVMVGGFFGKDSTTHKPKFCFRRGSNTVVYDLYITIHFILKGVIL